MGTIAMTLSDMDMAARELERDHLPMEAKRMRKRIVRRERACMGAALAGILLSCFGVLPLSIGMIFPDMTDALHYGFSAVMAGIVLVWIATRRMD